MNKSETSNTFQDIINTISKNEMFWILLLLLGILFILIANLKRFLGIVIDNNKYTKAANYIIGSVLIGWALIMRVSQLTPVPPQPLQNSLSPTPTPTLSPTSTPTPTLSPTSIITKPEAIQLINSYIDARRLIFSRAYSEKEAKKYLTGALYRDIVKCTTCTTSISWLRRNDAYYIYGEHTIKDKDFEDIRLVNNEPYIKVKISEKFKYFEKNLPVKDVEYCNYVTYTFKKDEDGWKIADYVKDSDC